ncbi:hypothetical protein FOZ61_000467 [Perkinsus olseni]|uniref:Uncharacterized protein n=1 Tax=Perkinsus olseni TaxID=32597 RepID=A0A7J6KTR6_PEROL|nr:hypothetical protein FOZ61_000467 [Perkinsus olseni]
MTHYIVREGSDKASFRLLTWLEFVTLSAKYVVRQSQHRCRDIHCCDYADTARYERVRPPCHTAAVAGARSGTRILTRESQKHGIMASAASGGDSSDHGAEFSLDEDF